MRTRSVPRLAARLTGLLVALFVLAALPAQAADRVPPNPRNPKGNDQTPQILRPAPQRADSPTTAYSYEDTNQAAIGKSTGCRSGHIIRYFVVPDSFTVYDVNLGFQTSHVRRGDIRVTLQSPNNGPEIVVINEDSDNTSQNYDLMLDDTAYTPIDDANDDLITTTPYLRPAQPSQPLSVFNGLPSAGTWTLRICDTYTQADDGTYLRSRLVLESPPSTPALEANKTASRHVVTAGMTIGYTLMIHNAGLGNASGVTLSDPIPAGATYVTGSVSTIGAPAASYNGAAIVWNGSLAAGASVVITYQVTVSGSAALIDNTATVTHSSLAWPLQPSVTSESFAGQSYLYTNETAAAIPDDGCASPVDSQIVVGDSFAVADLHVGLNVSHTFRGDLSATLISPQNTQIPLVAPDTAGVHDNFDVRLSSASTDPLDDGNPDYVAIPFYDRTVAPAASLGGLAGQNAQGTWTLRICDSSASDVGTLNHWSLFFYTSIAPDEPAVTIQAAAPNVSLTWLPVTDINGNPIVISAYQVWRSEQPGFTPGDASSPTPQPRADPTSTTFLDPVLNDTAHNYYYIVRAVSTDNVSSGNSNRTGKFTFTLTPGS